MRMPSGCHVSPWNSVSTPAMIFRSVLLPAPFEPMTPILAPGRKARVIPLMTALSGGYTLRTFCMVKMN